MRLRAEITNEKLTQDQQSQDADGMQAMSVFDIIYTIVRGYISSIKCFMRRWGLRAPGTAHLRCRSGHATRTTLKL